MPALVADPRLPVVSFTGSGPVGYAIHGRRPAQARRPSSWVATPPPSSCADWSSDADLDWAAQPDRDVRELPGRPVLRVGPARAGRPRGARPAARAARRQRWARRSPATRPTRPPTSARWSNEARRRAGRGLGRRGGRRRREGARRRDAGRQPRTRRRCWSTCRPTLAVRDRGDLRPGADGDRVRRRATRRSRWSTTAGSGCRPGVFTHDLQTAFAAHRELEVGGVVIGDVPELPGRPDAVRRGEGVRRRPRGPALRDGRLHLRARPGAHRPRPVGHPLGRRHASRVGRASGTAPPGRDCASRRAGGPGRAWPSASRDVVVLGSTGSVGTQALDVVGAQPGPVPRGRARRRRQHPESVAAARRAGPRLGVEVVAVGRAPGRAGRCRTRSTPRPPPRLGATGGYALPKVLVGPEAADRAGRVAVRRRAQRA